MRRAAILWLFAGILCTSVDGADDPPRVAYISSSQLLSEGDKLALECQATGAEPIQVLLREFSVSCSINGSSTPRR